MKLEHLNEANYWQPLRALAAETGCTFRQGDKTRQRMTTAFFLTGDTVVAYVVPVVSTGYHASITGYRAHGKYLPYRKQRRGWYINDFANTYVERKDLNDLIANLRPALRSETPKEAFDRDFFAKREAMLVNAAPRYDAPSIERGVAEKTLVAMFREGMLTDERVLHTKVGSIYADMDKPATPVLMVEALEEQSRRVDDAVGNEIIMELFRAAYDAGIKLAGLKE